MIRHRRRNFPPSPSRKSQSINSTIKHDDDLKIDFKLKSIFLLSMEREISQCILGYPSIQPNLSFGEFIDGMLEVEDSYLKFRQNGGGYSMRRGYQSSNETAKVWINEEKGVLSARFPYRAEVIDQFRSKIPKGKKSWNPELSIWEFSIECIDEVIDILSISFPNLINLTELTNQQANPQNGSKDILLSILDPDDKTQIYRLLAKKYHPDADPKNKDGEMMSRINVIFKKER